MTGRNQQRGFQPATTAQPAKGGHVYLFGNNGISENECSEEDSDCYELRSRGRERLRRSASRDRMDDIVYLVRDIQEGDTLNAISLQYFCSVADIKRANNLLTEQDFFALRSIKIPVKKFSVLTETLSPAPAAKPGSPQGIRRLSEALMPEAVEQSSSTPSSSSSSIDSVGSFLQEKDKDIEQLVKSTDPSRGSLNEVVSSLNPQRQPGDPERRPTGKKDPYYGADWGMRWWTAVAIMLVVGIITPVFYLLYYEVLMKVDASNHDTTPQSPSGQQPPSSHSPHS
ncbi:lysM and putative peptidoglycan-binding domain-containing protein 3-like [Megalops cyprinoides]|uniref:lysM and putative peptidoglycan-binding domain-containing protein 3-like n=1 Tax=Megalops cyprinoides TaxID=118141 RepID=UPI001864F29F|nr:lysM and putative peptidoglycan-binding domain-containing protein 3-like [Megalops cyprinoides]